MRGTEDVGAREYFRALPYKVWCNDSCERYVALGSAGRIRNEA